MKLRELLSGVPVLASTADEMMEITWVTADSREVRPGTLFLAIPGSQVDGHDFIPKVIEAGAIAAVTQREVPGIPCVQVEDTYRCMARIAANFYGHPSKKMTMIGLTGTKGKTTVTYLIKTILERTMGVKIGLIGTRQNLIGEEAFETRNTTPDGMVLQRLFARMVEAGCTHCVMEVSSHALAQHRVDEVDFEVGVFTNLSQDHLDYHKTMEAYRDAKALLFSKCRLGALNLDDPATAAILAKSSSKNITYGFKNAAADLQARDVVLQPEGISFTACFGGKSATSRLAIPGMFSVYNALSALSVGLLLGIPLSDCCEALSHAEGVVGRVELVPTPADYSVVIDYAHSPDSLAQVTESLRTPQGRLITLFGCGGDRDRTKRPIMGKLAAERSDLVIVTSDNPRTEEPGAIIDEILAGMKGFEEKTVVEPDRRAAIRKALALAQPGDTVLLAGKGHETYQEINHVRHHLDEREEIAEYFANKK